jgi:hypothetical protein
MGTIGGCMSEGARRFGSLVFLAIIGGAVIWYANDIIAIMDAGIP